MLMLGSEEVSLSRIQCCPTVCLNKECFSQLWVWLQTEKSSKSASVERPLRERPNACGVNGVSFVVLVLFAIRKDGHLCIFLLKQWLEHRLSYKITFELSLSCFCRHSISRKDLLLYFLGYFSECQRSAATSVIYFLLFTPTPTYIVCI